MAKINFGGVEEHVVTREEFPLERALETLRNETIAVIGYGSPMPGKSPYGPPCAATSPRARHSTSPTVSASPSATGRASYRPTASM